MQIFGALIFFDKTGELLKFSGQHVGNELVREKLSFPPENLFSEVTSGGR